MKFKNTLLLLLVFVVLGAYYWIVEVKQHDKKEEIKKESEKVVDIPTDSVDVIQLKNQYGAFEIKKIQGDWRITEPLYTDADGSTINSMLSSLKGAKKDKVFSTKPDELNQYGLGKQAVSVELQTKGGAKDSVRFGDNTPVGSFVFSNKTDSTVFTVNQSVKTTLDKKLFDIRLKKLLSFQRADVKNIIVQNSHGKFEFLKTGTNDWTLQGVDRPADQNKLSGILSKLENNKAKAFVDEDGTQLKKYGLAKPAFEVDLLLGPDKGQKKLLVSRKIDGKYYAKDDSRKPIFEIDSTLVKDINKKGDDFRSTDFAKFERNKVNRIKLEYGDTLFTLLKDTTNNWMVDDTSHQAVQQSKINTFFSNLDYNTTIKEFVKDGKYNPAVYGLKKPSLKVSLFNDAELLFDASFGKKKGDEIYAVNNSYESVYLVDGKKVKDLKLKLTDILQPKPAASKEAAAKK